MLYLIWLVVFVGIAGWYWQQFDDEPWWKRMLGATAAGMLGSSIVVFGILRNF